jgi:hypothetical protein
MFVGLVTDENRCYLRGPKPCRRKYVLFSSAPIRPTKIKDLNLPRARTFSLALARFSRSLVSLARSFFCSPRRRTPRARTPHAAPCPVPAPPPHARTHGRRAVPLPRAARSPWLVPAPPLRCAPSPHSPRRGRLVAVPRPRAAHRLTRPSPCPRPCPAPSPCPPPRRAPSACPALAVPAYSSCPIAVTHSHRRLLAVPPRRDPSRCRPSPRRPSPSNKVLT